MGHYKFSLLSHKRLSLLIPDAATNLQPYTIMPLPVGERPFYRCKYPSDTRFAFELDITTASIAEKVRYARVTARLEQESLAKIIGVSRSTILRLENGQVSAEHMNTDTLTKIAVACGREQDFCCDEYHAFMAGDYGAQIRKLRKEKGRTQIYLAGRLGVNVATVKRWESGRSRPSREHYYSLIMLIRENM